MCHVWLVRRHGRTARKLLNSKDRTIKSYDKNFLLLKSFIKKKKKKKIIRSIEVILANNEPSKFV